MKRTTDPVKLTSIAALAALVVACSGQSQDQHLQFGAAASKLATVSTSGCDDTCTTYYDDAATDLAGFVTVPDTTSCPTQITLEAATNNTGAPITVTRCTTSDCSAAGEPVTIISSAHFGAMSPPAKNWGPFYDTTPSENGAYTYYYFFTQAHSHLSRFSDDVGPVTVTIDACSSDNGGGGETNVQVTKFYDAAGTCNEADQHGIQGWNFNLFSTADTTFATPYSIGPTDASGEFAFAIGSVITDATEAVLKEQLPSTTVACGATYSIPKWVRTFPYPDDSYNVTAGSSVTFGNVCLGGGGGLTLGFWSNKNGQALVTAADLTFLSSLNLRNATGANFDPSGYAAFRTWILNATATNMAYMLSAQLASMELNVRHAFVSPSALIYAPNAVSAGCAGFATVQQIMDEANASLYANGYTVASNGVRAYQEALKNYLDEGNNNCNFVQPDPSTCGCTGYDCSALFP